MYKINKNAVVFGCVCVFARVCARVFLFRKVPRCKSGMEGTLHSNTTAACVPGWEDYCGAEQKFTPYYLG